MGSRDSHQRNDALQAVAPRALTPNIAAIAGMEALASCRRAGHTGDALRQCMRASASGDVVSDRATPP